MKKILLSVHVLLSILLIGILFLWFSYKISLSGYWADLVVFWLWFISGLAYIIINFRNNRVKIYGLTWIVIVIITMIPQMIIFNWMTDIITGNDRLMYHELDEEVRCEIVKKGLLHDLNITRKGGLFERQIFNYSFNDSTAIDDNFSKIQDFNKMQLLFLSQDSLALKLSNEKDEIIFSKKIDE